MTHRRSASGRERPEADAVAFSFVLPESETWRTRARSSDAAPSDATPAVAALRKDYERWSRWGLGLLASVLTVIGVFTTLVMIDALLAWTGPVTAVDVAVVAISVGMGFVGGRLLIRLWRSGRRLAAVAAWWIALPFRSGAAAPSAHDRSAVCGRRPRPQPVAQ